MIEPPTMKKPSSNFLSRMRSPRKSSNASSPGDDDPSSSRKQPHKDSSSRKQLLKDQYTAYSEKKDYDRHVKEVERQNRKNQEKQSKAEAWLIKKGFTKEEAKRNAAATVLQVYTALCNLPSRCHIYYSVRMGSMVCTPLYHRALFAARFNACDVAWQTSVRGRRVRSGRGISVSAALHEKKEDLNQVRSARPAGQGPPSPNIASSLFTAESGACDPAPPAPQRHLQLLCTLPAPLPHPCPLLPPSATRLPPTLPLTCTPDMLQKLAHATNHMTFRLVRDWVQSSLRNGVHDDPWLPHGANDQMMVWVDAFLKELNVRMDNEEDEITSVEFKKEMRELININNWPPPPPLWRNPLWWARCRILYALSPADRNSTYSSTVTVGRWMSLLYLLLWMPFGISGPAWLAYLLCVLTVDDEYQLLTFLLRFKVCAGTP